LQPDKVAPEHDLVVSAHEKTLVPYPETLAG